MLQQVKPIYDVVYPLYQMYLTQQAQYDAAVAAGNTAQAALLAPHVRAQKAAFETQLAGSGYSIASLIQSYQEGQQKLADGAAQIAAGEQQLQDAEAQLAAGQAQLDAAAQQIAAGEQQLSSGRTQLDNGHAQLNAAKGELAAGRETLSQNRAALSDDLTALDAYADDAEHLQAGLDRLMQEEGISARAGSGATNAAVIAAARQTVQDAQAAADATLRQDVVKLAVLGTAGAAALVSALHLLRRAKRKTTEV